MDGIDPWTLGLLSAREPSVAWRAHRMLGGVEEDDPAQQERRRLVAGSDNVRRMLAHRHPDGTIRAEIRTARTVDVIASGGTFADWGPTGRTRPNPYVSIDATWVCLQSGQRDRAAITPLPRARASR